MALHPDLVDKLNHFQSSILGEEDSDKDESRSEGSIDEMDDDRKQADGSSVSIKLQVQEEESTEAKMGSKGSQSGLKALLVIPRVNTINLLMELRCSYIKFLVSKTLPKKSMFETCSIAWLEYPKKLQSTISNKISRKFSL